MKKFFLALVDLFEGLGKEVFCFLVLDVAIFLLIKKMIDGGQFVDLTKSVGVAYITGATIGSTAETIITQFRGKAGEIETEVKSAIKL